MSNKKLPESYVRLKQYALLVEDICKDIDLRSFGFEPGVSFSSERFSLNLPEWFLKRLYEYVFTQQSVQADVPPESPLKNKRRAANRNWICECGFENCSCCNLVCGNCKKPRRTQTVIHPLRGQRSL